MQKVATNTVHVHKTAVGIHDRAQRRTCAKSSRVPVGPGALRDTADPCSRPHDVRRVRPHRASAAPPQVDALTTTSGSNSFAAPAEEEVPHCGQNRPAETSGIACAATLGVLASTVNAGPASA